MWLIDSLKPSSQPASMCNLYRVSNSTDEVAHLFNAALQPSGNAGEEVYPGYPSWVVENGRMRTMTWGFPLMLKGKSGQPLKPEPVNNSRSDKLGSPFWRPSFERRRCLIPMTAFAEAEGQKGSKTRTWISVPGQPAFACAGIWRDSDEWGAVYSVVMTDPCEGTAPVHDRMPVLLKVEDHEQWLTGSPAEMSTRIVLWRHLKHLAMPTEIGTG